MITLNHRKALIVSGYLLCATTSCHYHFLMHEHLVLTHLKKKKKKKTN